MKNKMKMIYEDVVYYVFAYDKDNFPTHEKYKEDKESAQEYAGELRNKFDTVYIQERRLYKVR